MSSKGHRLETPATRRLDARVFQAVSYATDEARDLALENRDPISAVRPSGVRLSSLRRSLARLSRKGLVTFRNGAWRRV